MSLSRKYSSIGMDHEISRQNQDVSKKSGYKYRCENCTSFFSEPHQSFEINFLQISDDYSAKNSSLKSTFSSLS
jgi:hypothetical protein